MSFSIATGGFFQGENSVASTSTTFSITTVATGDFILAEFDAGDTGVNGKAVTNVTSTRCTWSQFAPTSGALNLNTNFFLNVWKGTVNSVGADTLTVTFSASMGGSNCRFDGREFKSTSGNAFLDVFGTVNINGGTSSWASLTPAGSGELYWGWCEDDGSATLPVTPASFVGQADAHANGEGYCLSVPTGSPYTPNWSDSGFSAGIMVLVTEIASLPAGPPLGKQDLPYFPVVIPIIAGQRAGHSR